MTDVNKEKTEDSTFETADLGTAAFLITKGCKLVSANKERGRYSFVFSNHEACHAFAVEYVSSDFAKFDSTLKNLKNLIY